VRALTPDELDVPLRFPSGDRALATELHAIFDRFPIAGYHFDQRGGDTAVTVTPGQGVDADDLLARLRRVVEPEFPHAALAIAEGEEGPRLSADPAIEVTVFWAGDSAAADDGARALGPLTPRRCGDLMVGGADADAVERVVDALGGGAAGGIGAIVVRGLQPESATRRLAVRAPTVAAATSPIHIEPSNCDGCGVCVDVCPTDCISLADAELAIDGADCISCHLCGEFCPSGALRPYANDDAIATGSMLSRILGLPTHSPTHPLTHSPTHPPTVVLGLATVTLMEHAAALLINGELVAAIEEERLVRERHYAFKAPGRPGASLASDPTLPLDASWPMRSIDAVLKMAGLTLDDVDAIALNGMPYRFRHSFSPTEIERAPRLLRSGRLFFVPHHLCHALSAFGMSDYERAWILTIDGRGDCETLAWYRAEGDEVRLLETVPFFPDRSFGGVFETITRILGFGSHGQGSTMALAALGEPSDDFSTCLSIDDEGSVTLSEWDAAHRFDAWARDREAPMDRRHRNLAASAQKALEETVVRFLEQRIGAVSDDPICVAGGVGLSCRMNGVIRRSLQPPAMLVPPGANDAGTAVGAAIAAHRELTGVLPRISGDHTYLGPGWDDAGIGRQLGQLRVPFESLGDVPAKTAELIASGRIVCWFQGRMEFGPRALGGRSILADPRRSALKTRLNRMKSRQPWRPFGPSILAGHQSVWFEDDWDSRFMLFAVNVREALREKIPVVVHDDGSTRPQVVHADCAPRYHAMITAFFERTGIPMVVNTSYNTGGEPIVMTPKQALKSFMKLGADCLVMGDALITREALLRRGRA